jgi:thioredoxin 1
VFRVTVASEGVINVGAPYFVEASFESDVLKSSVPTIVDFTATWCGPCKLLAPIVDELAGAYAGRVNVGKVDVDQNPGIAARYGIRSVPTLLFFKGGEVVDKVQGVAGRDAIERKLRSAFALEG